MKMSAFTVLGIFIAILLFVAPLELPYGYYQFLRWVICISGIAVAVKAHGTKQLLAMWSFIIIAILFNPLIPIHLSKEIWQPIDIIAGLFFLIGAFMIKPLKEKPLKSQE